MKPMLARTVGPKFDKFPCYVQPKLNGVRALYQDGIFQSRGEKLWKPHFFQHMVEELKEIQLAAGPILDGELYYHGWNLQRINSAVGVNNNNPNEDTPQIEFHVFDMVNPNQIFSERWFDIMHRIRNGNLLHIKSVETAMVIDREGFDFYFNKYTAAGYEGIIVRMDEPYEYGEHLSSRTGDYTEWRSKSLWKHKQWEDSEFVCVGTTQGEGKASIGIGALVLECNYMNADRIPGQGIDTFKVGTGFDDDLRIELMRNPPIGKLIRVRYLCLTDDGIPFNPSFLAVMN